MGPIPTRVLATQTEFFDQAPVALDVGLGQVVEQPTALADQQQQASPAVVVVLVLLEVLSEVCNPAGEHGDLNFRRTGVTLVGGVLGDQSAAWQRHQGAQVTPSNSGRCAAHRGRSTRALTRPRPIERQGKGYQRTHQMTEPRRAARSTPPSAPVPVLAERPDHAAGKERSLLVLWLDFVGGSD